MLPSQPVQSVVGDPRAWPQAPTLPDTPYGVPLQASELLRRTFEVWRDDAVRLGLLTALPYAFVVVAAAAGVVGYGVADAHLFNSSLLQSFGPLQAALVGVLGGLFITSALFFVAAYAGGFLVVDERLRGESRSSGPLGALLAGLPHLGRLLVAYVVVGVAMAMCMVPAAACTAVAVPAESWPLGLGAAALAFLGVAGVCFVGLRLVAAGPALVAENLGPFAALQRSLDLTRGRVGDIFVACDVFFVVLFGLNAATTVLTILPLLGVLVQVLVGVALASLQTVFLFVLYAALRDAAPKG